MADLTTTITVQQDPRPGIDSPGVKRIYVITPATADPGDTFDITLSKYHADSFLGIRGFVHTTLNSVVVAETATTSVTAGVLTVTFPSGTGNTDKKRFYELLLGQGGL